MTYFKCFDCGHIWNIIFYEASEGGKLACPHCKSLHVHRIKKIHGWDREGKYVISENGFEKSLADQGPILPQVVNSVVENQASRKITRRFLDSIRKVKVFRGK